jgi:hypothetical protein
MSRYVDIGELADQVMASVKTASVTKTASAKSPKVRTSAAARELRKFAEDLQQMPDQDDVSDDDLEALMQDQEVQQLLEELQNNPELLQQLLAEQGDDGAGMDPGMAGDPSMGVDPSMGGDPSMGMDPGMGGDPSMQAAPMEGDPSMGAMPPGINPQDPDNDGDAGGDTDGDGDGPKPKKSKESDDDDDDDPDSEKGESKAPPSFGGKTAAEIRKIAAFIRDNDKRFKQIRMLKAANMLHAATALKHLTGGSK